MNFVQTLAETNTAGWGEMLATSLLLFGAQALTLANSRKNTRLLKNGTERQLEDILRYLRELDRRLIFLERAFRSWQSSSRMSRVVSNPPKPPQEAQS
jgi:hypothetical protein